MFFVSTEKQRRFPAFNSAANSDCHLLQIFSKAFTPTSLYYSADNVPEEMTTVHGRQSVRYRV